MNRWTAPLCSALVLICGATIAKDNPYEPMAWLLKRCWVGTLPDGKSDQHCYGWEYGDKFVRDWHVVRGDDDSDYRGQTLYAWDPKLGHVIYWYWTNTGSISTGQMEVDGETLVFPERHTLEDGSVMELRNEMRQLDQDRYQVLTRRRMNGGQWELMWDVIYTDIRKQLSELPPIVVPDGEQWSLVFNGEREDNYDVYRVGLDGSNLANLSQHPAVDWVYAGGSELLGLSARDQQGNRLFRISAQGDWQRIGDQTLPDSQISRSPDGQQLVMTLGKRDEAELYITDQNGQVQRQLTDNSCQDTDPNWSPDGQWILYRSQCGGASDLWRLNLESGDRRALTGDAGNDEEQGYGGEGPGRWSPDGSRIAWMSWHDGDWDIWVMHADGSEARDLTDNRANDGYPSWSPDGRYIAFDTDRDADYEIYVMDADGSHPRRITVSPGMDLAPVWLIE